MNNLKRMALILLLVVIIGLIISVFLPSTFYLERKLIINADNEQVFKQVNDLRNWENWSPWALKDPTIYANNKAFSVPSSGEGATFNWDSKNSDVGSGILEIIQSKKNEYIENKLDFGMGECKGLWNFKTVDDGVEVIWSIDIDFGFNPIAKFFGLFLEGQIAPDYELGLKRLKEFSENLPKIKTVKVTKELIKNDLWFLSIRDTVNQQEMNNIHGKLYAKINQYMDKKGMVVNESPLVIYHSWSDTLADIEVGIPIHDSTILGNDEIKLNRIKAGNVITATHYGAYERLPETYFGINEWMRKNKVVVIGPPWEVYITDPEKEPNPEKWQTQIYFPIE